MRWMNHMACSMLVVVLASGCGGSSNPSARAAIEATLPRIIESILSGDANLDPSLLVDPTMEFPNPGAAPPPSQSESTTLGQLTNDGTSGMSITKTVTFTRNADRGGTITSTVSETDTGFKFVEHKAILKKPTITLRIPSWGLQWLKSDGSGNAFAIIRIETTATVERSFTNENPQNQHKLVNFDGLPEPPAFMTGAGAGYNDALLQYQLTRSGDTLVAKIASATDAGGVITSAPTNPQAIAITTNPARLTAGGTTFTGGDSGEPLLVGSDPLGTFAADTTLNILATGTGGVNGIVLGHDLSGPIDPELEGEGPDVGYTGKLANLDGVNDGTVQAQIILVSFFSFDFSTPQLESSVGEFGLGDLTGALYLPAIAFTGTPWFVVY